jgi:hypothetical protein
LFAAQTQAGAAGDQDLQPGSRRQQRGGLAGCVQDLLEVIEYQQQFLVALRGGQGLAEGAA